MELGVQGSFEEEAERYVQAMRRISIVCGCEVCSQAAYDNLDGDTYDDLAIEPFCLTLLTSVVICLVQCLSCVDLPLQATNQQINPYRLRIESFYLEFRENGRMIEPTVERLLNDSSQRRLLNEVALIFGWRQPNTSHGDLSAIVSAGLCF